MNRTWLCAGMLIVTGLATLLAAQEAPPGPLPTPSVTVGPAVAQKAANPTPSPAAKNQTQKTSIGKGAAFVKASAPSAYWTDLVDIDADGLVEDNEFLLDQNRGILYTYRYDNYQCANGTSQNGDVLMGVYTKGNTAGRPVGSGWFVVEVKAGQCAETRPGLYGCRFNAAGKPTTCGSAKVKEASGEVEFTVVKK
ncbi:MAG TPA: hypothetical protein VMU53_08540 [Candidatus Sulfotelmatobacter sp.]|nr:hypothetical protein [Candidatus Sulfotelmatobacter sp.]